MNKDKTEIMICSTPHKVKNIKLSPFKIDSSDVHLSKCIKNLGVYLDETLCMELHVSKLCQMLYIELRKLGHIRSFVSIAAAKKLASAFILSRMDYCNSLLAGIPVKHISKLQRIQNIAARIVTRTPAKDHQTTACLKYLHWLPVKARIDYKIASIYAINL